MINSGVHDLKNRHVHRWRPASVVLLSQGLKDFRIYKRGITTRIYTNYLFASGAPYSWRFMWISEESWYGKILKNPIILKSLGEKEIKIRHSSEGWNPVLLNDCGIIIYIPASAGMTVVSHV